MTDGVNTLDVAAIRERCNKATPGPWYCTGPVGQVMTGQWVAIADTWYENPTENWEHNVAFIAAARTDVPALLDALAQAEAANARLQAALTETMARYLAARDLIAQYDAIWSQPVDRDWDEQTEAGRAAYRALAPDAIARALGDAAPATRGKIEEWQFSAPRLAK